eukprot:TRINITY_DN35460_c1_g1_i2.p1 TRINITY_DN35460_c1_g1~~TRINITY_DN35460_c1_g1_i2.p1  ORF type:complete len:128 (+),score=25.93 TRINITY_DN35460_c1_g1_i2:909-1292(+)
MDNMIGWKMFIVNACSMFLETEETMNHLLTCKVMEVIWKSILVWFECSWVLLASLLDHCRNGSFWQDPQEARICGRFPSWRKFGLSGKNGTTGASKANLLVLEILIEREKFSVASWVSVLPHFLDTP